jgi:hypothetical protein
VTVLGQRTLLALPAAAVLTVALVILVIGKPRPVIGVRLRGGPTEGAHGLSWRLEVVERLADRERAVAGRVVDVEARLGGGQLRTWRGVLDAEGAVPVFLPLDTGPVVGSVHLRVSLAGAPDAIAEAPVSLTQETWAASARRRGGWVESRSSEGFVIRAAAERGVFAVPFEDPLWVEVHHGGLPVGAIDAVGEGVVIGAARLVPQVEQRLRILVRPLEHSASVAIRVRAPDGATASLDLVLAVVPGALSAVLGPDGLSVSSAIARDRAYVAIVGESERVAGGTVVLAEDGQGGSHGVLPLPPLPESGPLWAVVSTEPDFRSASLVGWPVRAGQGTEPPMTFDVPDALLLDTVGDAVLREAGRVLRVRLLGASLASLTLAITALFVVRGARRARAGLEAHLASAGSDVEATLRVAGSGGGSAWLVVAAVLCFGLAVVLVFGFVLWR